MAIQVMFSNPTNLLIFDKKYSFLAGNESLHPVTGCFISMGVQLFKGVLSL